ncbi:MAG: M48 family metallopeptidase, partial [Bacteroidales bacterium]|nr:M48 family metallopeptidase [Bacteroidales bacterium]
MADIYLMDGSRRSTKANAFFSGFGPRKKIVLFDTLVNDLSTQEVVAVLAHEVGHYRLKHTLWGVVASLLQMAIILFLLGLVVNSPLMAEAVGVAKPSFYIGLTVFGMILTPVSLVASLLMNWLSRRNEFAADAFGGKTYSAEWLASALKKISVKALSNPTPHPAYVFFHYSHPPLLQRLEALEKR